MPAPEPTSPVSTGAVPSRVYRDGRLGVLTVIGLLAGMAVCVQQITQPDYNTKVRNPWGIILPVMIPLMAAFLLAAWRGWRTRIETNPRGVRAVRIAQWPFVPWDDITGVEVLPTSLRWGYRIMVRLPNRRLVRLMTLPVTPRLPWGAALAAGRAAARSRAQHIADAVEADRQRWTARPTPPLVAQDGSASIRRV